MYFLDRADFNCNAIPSNWSTYEIPLTGLITNYSRCFNIWYNENIPNIAGTTCESEVTTLYNEWVTLVTTTKSDLTLLIDSLSTPPFDINTYNNYIESYDLMLAASSEITVLINNKCSFNVIDSTVFVDSNSITNDNNKLDRCVGVYMEQIDLGSSFYGTITTIADAVTEDSYTGYTGDNPTF